jgi:pimeloyl-[acyl-carrier protein] methyl ester esterase
MTAARRLVLVHGWGVGPAWFDPLREHLPGWEIHAPPLPGHAGAEDAGIDVDALAVRWADAIAGPALWCGWSLGGHVALAAARLRAERVRGLVLCAVSPRFDRAPDWPHGRPPGELRAMRRTARQDAAEVIAGFARLLRRGREAPVIAASEWSVPAPAARDSGLAQLQSADLRSALTGIPVPAVWVIGDDDPLVPVAAAGAGADAMPQGRREIFADAGHAPFLAEPARFAALVERLHEETS